MRRVRLPLLAVLVCAVVASASIFTGGSRVRAEMWCASALWVHEWGVQVFGADGGASATPVALPSYFHGPASRPRARPAAPPAVRDMPPDGGERELPVLHFYSAGSLSNPIPVGIEVGFARGEASRWFPQVDRHTPAASARSDAARAARERLVRARAVQPVLGQRRSLGPDPTMQLEWTRLDLSAAPRHPRARTTVPWVERLRSFGARWVNSATESERFVFYEANTTERVAIVIERGREHRAGRRHYLLRNRSTHTVHGVFLVHREGADVFVLHAPAIPAGSFAGFVLEEHRVAPDQLADATLGRLRRQLVDAQRSAPPPQDRWDGGGCGLRRDPAVPVERAEGHQLFAHEVDAILEIWGARFFDARGTTVVYREDTAYLDAQMPLAIYTDMYNYPLVRRAGLALWSGVQLP